MDWPTFIGTVIVLLVAVTPMMVFPKASEKVITDINSAISNSIGSVYLFMGLIILFFVLYIAFGRYGNVTLGKATDRPEFNNFSWASMLFCAVLDRIFYIGVSLSGHSIIKYHRMVQKGCQMKHLHMQRNMGCSIGDQSHGQSMCCQHYLLVI